MADTMKLHVTWTCPGCPAGHAAWMTNLVFEQGVRKVENLTMVLEDNSRRRMVDHLRSHVNEIKLLWHAMESAMGSLGLSMDVTVSQELEGPQDDERPDFDDEMDWRDRQAGF